MTTTMTATGTMPAAAAPLASAGSASVTPDGGAAPPTVAATLTVTTVSDPAEFLAMKAEWNEAVDRAAPGHPFLRHEWLRTWWECFGEGRTLHILVVRAAGRVAAIAPLMREHVQMYGIPIRRIDLMHNDHTPRADFIVAERAGESYRAIWQALSDARASWDLLQLSRLVRESPTCETMRRLSEEGGCPTGLWQGDVSPYLTLQGTWDDYHASLPAKFRSNLRNRLSRLTRIGEPALEVLDGAEAIERGRDDALRLEASGWKQEAGTAISSDPAVERFYRLLAERATAGGWLRLMFLTVGGRRIATSYGSCHGRRLFLFKTGYDPEFATCSPFKLLTFFAIQAAYAEGLSEVDFLGNAEPWKLEWTDTSRTHDWLFSFSGSVRARLLRSVKFQMVPELKKWRA